ncbi:hypothetical protein [uncultured Sphingomonas sp.]|uniref:hypothetical protein n=1 Tax=uncultured Sphingomonas sp. TaxID=158754 RepID=UPI0025E4ED26|nr:hypothetical protein [uncultured Sphingomonas sp.]
MTSRRAWATYVTAHVGKSLLWSGSDLLTLYLLVSVYGLAANALADFAVGNHLARRPHHAGPIAAAALVLSGISFPTTVLLAPMVRQRCWRRRCCSGSPIRGATCRTTRCSPAWAIHPRVRSTDDGDRARLAHGRRRGERG